MSNSRRVRLVSTTGKRHVGPMLRQLPAAHTRLHDLVRGRGSVHHVGNPSMPSRVETNPSASLPLHKCARGIYIAQVQRGSSPARLDLRRVVVVLLVVDPACSDCTARSANIPTNNVRFASVRGNSSAMFS